MQVKAGDIFECESSFYQAIKATAKTATIRPIESTFEGLADAYGWERKYMPLPNCFTYDPIMGREASDNGKRLKVRDYGRAKNSPELELCGYRLTLWEHPEHLRHIQLERQAMKDREPKQWHELLQIISEAKRDLEKAIAAEKATGQSR